MNAELRRQENLYREKEKDKSYYGSIQQRYYIDKTMENSKRNI